MVFPSPEVNGMTRHLSPFLLPISHLSAESPCRLRSFRTRDAIVHYAELPKKVRQKS